MMRSLFSGVSGLKSHQTRMDVIGNNIANINTVGFKSSRVTFSDMLSQTTAGASGPTNTMGGTNPKQIGLGTAVASVDLIFNDGSPQSTGKNTDVALSGNGLFVVKSGNNTYYTRDGAFEFDAQGNYVLPGSGYFVQGWNAVDGSLNTNAQPVNIVVPAGKTMPANATTQVDFSGNLNASAPIITAITYTSGGGSSDPDSVVNFFTINSLSYTYEDSATGLTGSVKIGSSATAISGATSDSKVTEVTLHLSTDSTLSPSSTTVTLVTPGREFTTGSAVEGLTGSFAAYNGWTIDSFDLKYTDVGGPLTSDTATTEVTLGAVPPGRTSGTVTEVKIGEIDKGTEGVEGSGATSETTVSGGTATYKIGELYTGSAESVNVDGKNVISAVLTLSDGSTQKVTTGFYEVGHSVPITTVVTIYDTEGKTHAVTMLIDKDNVSVDKNPTSEAQILGVQNRWRTYLAPSVGHKGPAGTYETDEADGSHTNGYFNRESGANGDVSYIYFNNDGSYNAAATRGGALELEYSNGNGAAPTTSAINFTNLTQYSGNSTAFPTADGNAFGVLQSVAIDTAGIITGTYTNSVRRFEAQIAVAQFINSAGLTKIGTSLYQESNNSGTANIKTVRDLGLTITPAAVEMSNVDLSSELSDMIITQRGFQSNSKIITVADEMLETIINMKR